MDRETVRKVKMAGPEQEREGGGGWKSWRAAPCSNDRGRRGSKAERQEVINVMDEAKRVDWKTRVCGINCERKRTRAPTHTQLVQSRTKVQQEMITDYYHCASGWTQKQIYRNWTPKTRTVITSASEQLEKIKSERPKHWPTEKSVST